MKATIGPIRLWWKRGLGRLGIWDWELVRVHSRPLRGPDREIASDADLLLPGRRIGWAVSVTLHHRRGKSMSVEARVSP